MRYKAIHMKDYKGEKVQFGGYYILKIKEDMPPPEIFFVEDDSKDTLIDTLKAAKSYLVGEFTELDLVQTCNKIDEAIDEIL